MFSAGSVALTIFLLILFAGIYLTLFDLLGTVVIFLDVLFYSLFHGFDQISGVIIVFLLFITIAAETVDFFLVEKGALQPVITKKKMGVTAISAVAGAFIMAPLWGGPGIWGGFFLGGLATLMIMEIFRKKKLKYHYHASNRDIFTLAIRKFFKGVIALFMVAVSLSHIYS